MVNRLREHEPKRARRRRVVLKTVAVLPTLLTLGNVLCGFAAVFVASRPETVQLPFHWTSLGVASLFIFLGMLFDGLDGRVARLTRSTSELGEQLDSMADMVTFGVSPAFLTMQLVGVQMPFLSLAEGTDRWFDRFAIVVAGIYVACAALRLARFNIEKEAESEAWEDRYGKDFKGLPSPGAAGTVASLVLLHQNLLVREPANPWIEDGTALGMLLIILLASFAMVSRLRYVHVMERYVQGQAAFSTLVKVVVLGLLMVIYWQGAVAGAFCAYAVSAPIARIWRLGWRGLRQVTDDEDDDNA